jgi:hypothetical protein
MTRPSARCPDAEQRERLTGMAALRPEFFGEST